MRALRLFNNSSHFRNPSSSTKAFLRKVSVAAHPDKNRDHNASAQALQSLINDWLASSSH